MHLEGTIMLKISTFLIILVLSGCSLTPPAPPSCNGEFHPVNKLNGEQ